MIDKDPGKIYLEHPQFKALSEILDTNNSGNTGLEGLSGSAKSLLLAAVFNSLQTTHLVVLPEKEDAAYFYNDLVSVLGEDLVFFFPSTYKRSIQYGKTEASNIVLRTEVMNHLASGKRKCIVVTYPESVMEKVISKKVLKKNTLKIAEGDNLTMEFLIDILVEYNFSRVDFVYEPGQFSVRGSIIDIFSYSCDKPYRIDFFGDDVETIRTFNIDDQLSIEKLKEISIIPNVQDISIERTNENITEFIPPSSLIWLDNFGFSLDRISSIYNSSWSFEGQSEQKSKRDLAISGEHLESELSRFRVIEFSGLPHFEVSHRFKFNTQPQPSFNKNFELLGDRLTGNIEDGLENLIVSESETQIARLRDIFSELNPDLSFESKIINLHRGFTDADLNLALFTDHQIFDRYHKFRIRGAFNRRESLTIREITGLNPGDFVVHIDHGIGRFGGLEKIDVNGKLQETIKLVYKDNDILYVGIHALHRISKYKSKDASEPKIYKLGSASWQKVKNNTKRKVKDIARDLILLYAKRMTVEGFSYSPDSFMQRELEASFIYEDTPDQYTATLLVKKDMEKKHPMDRLVCGDVGFGKTEIAVRAAFKSACDNKQVAILVPTTILALQHYQTFSQRLKDFPVEIDYISRHRKAADQREIKNKLSTGKLDIIIGTHKLVAKDINFKDLGLLIIDEEQKFGVSVKEKIKGLKSNVDTLTLTATPIPRTLQFSLMGARDLSIINTPPPNRMPIITELHGFNEDILKEGISYELNRNGQVFFIHNRVDNIGEVQAIVNRIMPGIKSAIVHGQMEGRLVENIMYDFIHGDYDVLIATTIIESGLDIPNANTIFINNAHHFGLSELHQLRGRVGRSNKKAFCYLLAPPTSVMTQEARRRIKAIEEFSELGSGFNIAMQDLDIRGAGNLLGGEQSGFIADIGFETYQRILKEAIDELKNEELKQVVNTTEHKDSEGLNKDPFVNDCYIETDMEIMFPDSYVSNISERIRLYKKLNELQEEEQLSEFEKELIDRFGNLPQASIELFHLVRLRRQAIGMGVEKVILKREIMIVHFTSNQDSGFYKSSLFVSIINYVNNRHSQISVKHTESRLSLTVKNITSIQDAKGLFDNMLQYHENVL
jgi:transcription-repair coupling factor (superfamily II helicase)